MLPGCENVSSKPGSVGREGTASNIRPIGSAGGGGTMDMDMVATICYVSNRKETIGLSFTAL